MWSLAAKLLNTPCDSTSSLAFPVDALTELGSIVSIVNIGDSPQQDEDVVFSGGRPHDSGVLEDFSVVHVFFPLFVILVHLVIVSVSTLVLVVTVVSVVTQLVFTTTGSVEVEMDSVEL